MNLHALLRSAGPEVSSSRSQGGTAFLDRLSGWSDDIMTVGIVSLALGAGLAAAYGRELQAGRMPERSWWIARFLLLPLLAIGATAASEAFDLAGSTTAFTAAMLSLGGYDCLRLIEAHWRARLAAISNANMQFETEQSGSDAANEGGRSA